MTMILPVGMTILGAMIGGPIGGLSGSALGAGIGMVTGVVSTERGGGVHLKKGESDQVRACTYVAMTANWGIQPVLAQYSESNREVILDDMYNATIRERLEGTLQQWSPIHQHVLRAARSGIVPLKALRWVKSNYRDRMLGQKLHDKAVSIARTVAQCYAAAHAQPEQDYAWYEQWAGAIGLKPVEARSIWNDAIQTQDDAGHVDNEAAVHDDDVVVDSRAAETASPMVAVTPAPAPRTLWDLN